MNIIEKTVIEGIISNLKRANDFSGADYEIDNEHKYESIIDACDMLNKLLELPVEEEILKELKL